MSNERKHDDHCERNSEACGCTLRAELVEGLRAFMSIGHDRYSANADAHVKAHRTARKLLARIGDMS